MDATAVAAAVAAEVYYNLYTPTNKYTHIYI